MSSCKINTLPLTKTEDFCETFNTIFPTIPVDSRTLIENLWCDTNAAWTVSFVAEKNNRIAGILHAVLYDKTLYISVIGTLPECRREKIATQLYERLMQESKDLDYHEIRVSDYPYGYILPGVVEPEGIAFFTSLGFYKESIQVAMQRDLSDFSYSEEILKRKQVLTNKGYSVVRINETKLRQVMDFFDRCMASDWKGILASGFRSKKLLANGVYCTNPSGVMVGASFYGLVGNDLKRFGPIGVDPECRRLSIGQILLEECLALQFSDGLKRSYFLWCHEGSPAYRMYIRSNFSVIMKMQIMVKIQKHSNLL